MTPKFVKPILIDNGNDLSTLPFNSDIRREKVDFVSTSLGVQ